MRVETSGAPNSPLFWVSPLTRIKVRKSKMTLNDAVLKGMTIVIDCKIKSRAVHNLALKLYLRVSLFSY
jgi:hypothetical protein